MTSPLLKINKNLHFEEIMYRNKQAQFLWHHESCVFFDLSLGLKKENQLLIQLILIREPFILRQGFLLLHGLIGSKRHNMV